MQNLKTIAQKMAELWQLVPKRTLSMVYLPILYLISILYLSILIYLQAILQSNSVWLSGVGQLLTNQKGKNNIKTTLEKSEDVSLMRGELILMQIVTKSVVNRKFYVLKISKFYHY